MFPGWGYLILTKTISLDLLIFAIPFGFLGLTVILNFEIPDMEADIHGGKHNLIVRKGRFFSFITIMVLYLAAFIFFLILSYTSWLHTSINIWLITLLASIPLFVSTVPVFKKIVARESATKYAISNSIAGFLSVIFITGIISI
jgi:1,4-dihydroxy-2-naphthoate octaprenyltransferase